MKYLNTLDTTFLLIERMKAAKSAESMKRTRNRLAVCLRLGKIVSLRVSHAQLEENTKRHNSSHRVFLIACTNESSLYMAKTPLYYDKMRM